MCFKLNLKEEYGENVRKVMPIDPKNEKANYHFLKYEAFSRNKYNSFESMKQRIGKNEYLREQSKRQLLEYVQLCFSFAANANVNWFTAIKSQNVGQFFSPKAVMGKGPYGRGMFAAEDILPGQILIIEYPLASFVYSQFEEFKKSSTQTVHIQNLKPSTLFTNEILKLLKISKEFKQKFLQLSSKTGSNLKNVKLQNIDINEVTEILESNTFSNDQLYNIIINQNEEKDSQKKPQMIYEKCCIFNHRCEYNCDWINIGKAMIVYATSSIKKGEQLFVTYNGSINYIERQMILNRVWGIHCSCTLCQYQLSQFDRQTVKTQSNMFKNHLMVQRGKFQISQMIEKTCDLPLVKCMYEMKKVQAGDQMLTKIFPMKNNEINKLRTQFKIN